MAHGVRVGEVRTMARWILACSFLPCSSLMSLDDGGAIQLACWTRRLLCALLDRAWQRQGGACGKQDVRLSFLGSRRCHLKPSVHHGATKLTRSCARGESPASAPVTTRVVTCDTAWMMCIVALGVDLVSVPCSLCNCFEESVRKNVVLVISVRKNLPASVRKNVVPVISHVTLNDTMKVKGYIEMGVRVEDEDDRTKAVDPRCCSHDEDQEALMTEEAVAAWGDKRGCLPNKGGGDSHRAK